MRSTFSAVVLLALTALAPWAGMAGVPARAASTPVVTPAPIRSAAIQSALPLHPARSMATATATAVAAAPRQGLFVIDQDHHTVVSFPAGGLPPRTVVAGLTDPQQIAVDRHDNVYVLDTGTQSLIKAAASTGVKTTIRSNVGPDTFSMAIDGMDNLFFLDGHTIVEVLAATGRQSLLGTWTEYGKLTVDAAGHVSITGHLAGASDGLSVVATLSSTGAPPVYRILGTADQPAFVAGVLETPSGTMYVKLAVGGGSGAQYIVQLLPGSPTPKTISTRWADYAFAANRNGTFYLMQDRYWCPAPGRPSGQCVDDYAVDSLLRFGENGQVLSSWAVNHLSLPERGMAVDDAGYVYAALIPVSWFPGIINSPQPRLVRVNPSGGTPLVLANGHFLYPTVSRS